jgi:hypothetical protein
MVVMQAAPLPALELDVDGWRVTVHEPGHDPEISHRGEWMAAFENPRHRYGDIVRIDVSLPPSLDQDPLWTSAVLPQLEVVAQNCVQRLATLLPVETGQFWIGHQPSPMPWFRMALRVSILKESGPEAYMGNRDG